MAMGVVWLSILLPGVSVLIIRQYLGGAVHFPEILTLALGHSLFSLTIVCIAASVWLCPGERIHQKIMASFLSIAAILFAVAGVFFEVNSGLLLLAKLVAEIAGGRVIMAVINSGEFSVGIQKNSTAY